jgi:hypothetical protein
VIGVACRATCSSSVTSRSSMSSSDMWQPAQPASQSLATVALFGMTNPFRWTERGSVTRSSFARQSAAGIQHGTLEFGGYCGSQSRAPKMGMEFENAP